MVGHVPLGSDHPIRIQTMTTTDTKDVAATVDQVLNTAFLNLKTYFRIHKRINNFFYACAAFL